MKIMLNCMQCLNEDNIPSREFVGVELNENDTYEMECSKGHKTVTMLQTERFEILFEMGLLALKNGYYFETVASITTSLERFREWCIRVLMRHNEVSLVDVNKVWKYVASQSERQLGAFYFLYLQSFKEAPDNFNSAMTRLRNNVLHKGIIKTYEEVYGYCEYVADYIRPILKKINEECQKSVMETSMEKLGRMFDPKIKTSTMAMGTFLQNYADRGAEGISFSDAITKFNKEYTNKYYGLTV